MVCDDFQCFLVIIIVGQEVYPHISFIRFAIGHHLHHITISIAYLASIIGLMTHGCGKKLVVKVDYIPQRPIVNTKWLNLNQFLIIAEFIGYIIKKAPVTRTKPVDALLNITHNKVLRTLMTHTLKQQHLKILPLHGACVLKLVYHDMMQLSANLLEYKWRVAIVYKRLQQVLSVTEHKAVGLSVQLSYLIFYMIKQSHLVEVPKRKHR